MVGIPGKSSGCSTCRKRKVKCDAGRPYCQRCMKSKLECGGYERYPVFINRTGRGLEKRTRLEETRSQTVYRHTGPDLNVKLHRELDGTAPAVVTLLSPAAQAVPFKAWFHASFVQCLPSKHALQTRKSWLGHVMDNPTPTPVLSSSFLALAAFHWSKAHDSRDVEQEARGMYARSMYAVRRAIANKDLVQSDDVLAACYMMALFELFDSSSWQGGGWTQHVAGIISMMQFRGSQHHYSELSLIIFEHVRYVLMITQLLRRKSSVLSQETWISSPWKHTKKPPEQTIFDHGLRLATLLAESDSPTADGSPGSLSDIHGSLRKVALDVEQLLILRDEEGDSNFTPCYGDIKDGPEPVALVKTPQRLLHITARSIQLVALQSADEVEVRMKMYDPDLCRQAGQSHFNDHGHRRSTNGTLSEGAIDHRHLSRNELAQDIIATAFLCHGIDIGPMAAARVLFSLCAAIEEFAVTDFWHERASLLMASLQAKESPVTKTILEKLPIAGE